MVPGVPWAKRWGSWEPPGGRCRRQTWCGEYLPNKEGRQTSATGSPDVPAAGAKTAWLAAAILGQPLAASRLRRANRDSGKSLAATVVLSGKIASTMQSYPAAFSSEGRKPYDLTALP